MLKAPHKVTTVSLAVLLQAPPEGILGALIGSTFPDIDIRMGLVHRTWTHWWPFYMLPAGILFYCLQHYGMSLPAYFVVSFLAWFCVGAYMHLIEDCITYSGIPSLSPVTSAYPQKAFLFSTKQRFSLMLTSTGGGLEKAIMVTVVSLVVFIFLRDTDYRNEYITSLESWLTTIKHSLYTFGGR